MKKVWVGLFVALAIAARANAAPIVISNITGGWQNANPVANATISNGAGQEADIVRWGGTGNANTDSGYQFDPTNNPVPSPLNVPFSLGVFTHFNNPIPSDSSITGIDYSFAFDTNGTPNALSDVFHFDHNETPNELPCQVASPPGNPCNDIVTVSSLSLNSHIIVGGTDYFFNLLGFSTDGGATISSQFFTVEGQANDATLYGLLTTQPISAVPEPASLVLMGSGLILLGSRLRKRSR